MAEGKGSGLLSGLFVGAAIGAGAAFLFGTKRGKQVRDKLKRDYPEVFNKIEGLIDDTREGLSEGYGGMVKEAKVLHQKAQKSETGKVAVKGVNKLGQTVETVGRKMQEISQVDKTPAKKRPIKK